MAVVVITGGLGTLGVATADRLRADAHDVVLLDARSHAEHATVTADIRQVDAMRPVLADADVLVHLASLHGRNHMARYGFDEFWSTNVDGTRALFTALAGSSVSNVVLASTMAVYGPIPGPPRAKWETRDESTPVIAHDTYTLTKLVCEQLADFTAVQLGISASILRFGHFAPADPLHQGFRLLFGGVDVRDAASAIADVMACPGAPASVRRLNIHARSPLVALTDRLDGCPTGELERMYPQFMRILRNQGIAVEPFLWGRSTWPVERARADIGYVPKYDFDDFVARYVSGDTNLGYLTSRSD